MDHAVVFNSLSLPAQNARAAYDLMVDACHGILELGAESDRFLLYYDDEKNRPLSDCPLAEGYCYQDFLGELEANQDIDLLLFLMETEDKSPALDHLMEENPEIFEMLSACHFYLPGRGADGYMDGLGIAWLLEATLLSLLTDNIWDTPQVEVARWKQGTCQEEFYYLPNVSKYINGRWLREKSKQLAELSLEKICPQCQFAKEFTNWYNKLNDTNRYHVRKKLQMASQRGFRGGQPLFKTLKDADGMREIRLSAYPGGAIRILFGALPGYKQAILGGFIKKSDPEGYPSNIKKEKVQWEILYKKADTDV